MTEYTLHHPKMTERQILDRIDEIDGELDMVTEYGCYDDRPELLDERQELEIVLAEMPDREIHA